MASTAAVMSAGGTASVDKIQVMVWPMGSWTLVCGANIAATTAAARQAMTSQGSMPITDKLTSLCASA